MLYYFVKHLWEIQWEIYFRLFKILTKTLQKKMYDSNMDILIWNLLSESIFDFKKWSNWKYAKRHIWVFSVWPLPKVKNWSRKQISNENVTNLKKNLERFSQYFKKSKNWFRIVFPKSEIDRVDKNIDIQIIRIMGSWGSHVLEWWSRGGRT